MPVQVSYPGVYIREVPSGVRTITGVSTSITAFIGMAASGPLDTPTRVLSFTDFARTFADNAEPGEMADQVRQFFQNGGQQAFITRIANGASAARVSLRDETGANEVLILEAKSAGRIGETLRVEVDYATAIPESTFNLRVTREATDTAGVPRVVETEVFRDLSMNPAAGSFIVNVLESQSRLVKAELGDGLPPLINGFSLAGVLQGAGTIDRLLAILAGNPGRFQISVDASPFVTVQVNPANLAQLASNFEGPINLALAPFGKQVRVTLKTLGGFSALRIRSSTSGGSVSIQPALSNDIAVPMQMGVAQGGLEIDGHAPRRPAPTGLFSILGTAGSNLDALSNFIAIDPASLTQFSVADTAGGGTIPAVTWTAAAGTNMSVGSIGGSGANSLRNVQENLQGLADQINSSTDIDWSATRSGLRIVMIPQFGDADADVATTISTAATDIGTAIANQLFAAPANVRQYRLGNFGAIDTYEVGNQAGSDGMFPVPADYQQAFTAIDRDVDLFNLMALPRARGQADADRLLTWGPASTFCQQRRAFLLVDPREIWRSVDDAVNGTTGVSSLRTGSVKGHEAVYWPRIQIATPQGSRRTVDPNGTIAGLMARIDSNRGVWKAPAGIEADLRGVRGVEHTMSDLENGRINPEAVNAIRVFPNGIVSWGARTIDGFNDSPNTDYRYIPIRRLALFIEESLYRGLKFAVFEPNDEPLWAQIRLAAGAFMNNLFRQGAFQGQKASDAYFVKVDSETTTQNDINLGIVNVVVGFAPLKPAEFVVITIQQKAGQVQT
jgi:Bacteriophage tail sheath protein